MGTSSPDELLKKWKVEDLTIQQAIGQLLQHLVMVRNELNDDQLERGKLKALIDQALAELQDVKAKQQQLRADVDKLLAQANLTPVIIKHKRRGRPPKKR